ncbi:MAG: response regulator [Polyangiaceae bacterium]
MIAPGIFPITGGSVTATLLAVDDSKTMRKVLEITFAGEDYRMVLVNSPADAMAKVRSERPVIALVDALLGGNSGYDLRQQIKAEAPQVGVIVLSSKQHPYDRVKGGAVGADDFIDKPYDSQALIDKVAALAQKLASAPAVRPAAPAAAAPARAATDGGTRPGPLGHAPPAAASAPMRNTMSFGAPSGAPASTMPIARPAPQISPAAQPPAAQPMAPQPASPFAKPAVAPATAARPVAPAAVAQHAAPAPAPAPAPAVHAAPAAASPAALVGASMEQKLVALGLTKDQISGVLSLSREVVEQVVWEVVPVLAETMIREEINRLTAE